MATIFAVEDPHPFANAIIDSIIEENGSEASEQDEVLKPKNFVPEAKKKPEISQKNSYQFPQSSHGEKKPEIFHPVKVKLTPTQRWICRAIFSIFMAINLATFLLSKK